MAKKTRACHLLAVKLINAKTKDGFVSREALIKVLLRSRYASTAEGKLSGYVNDIRVYEGGELEMMQAPHSRLFQSYRLVNVNDFDPKTGFNTKLDAAVEEDVETAEDQVAEQQAA